MIENLAKDTSGYTYVKLVRLGQEGRGHISPGRGSEGGPFARQDREISQWLHERPGTNYEMMIRPGCYWRMSVALMYDSEVSRIKTKEEEQGD